MRIALAEVIHAIPGAPRPFILGQSVLGGGDVLGGADGAPLLSPLVTAAAERLTGEPPEIFNAESPFIEGVEALLWE